LLGVRKGVAAVVVLGWLLLPMAGYWTMDLLPAYTKTSASVFAAGIAWLAYDRRACAAFRPSLIDLPMLVFCLSPMATSLSNGLGPYDGYVAIWARLLSWGFPYLIGRISFGTLDGMRDLALWTVLGGLVYAPLCLIEVKMGPQLADWVYGMPLISGSEAYRYGGWRPYVFMQTGLALGLFMCGAALVAMVLWRRKVVARIGGVPSVSVAVLLIVVAVVCKSTGAVILMILALGVVSLSQLGRSRIPVLVMLLLAPAYMSARSTGAWSGASLVQAADAIGENQAGSLQMRLTNEDLLAARAMQKPVLGWGVWGGKGASGADGGFNSMGAVTDGWWAIVFGTSGFVGLISFTVAMLLPVVWLCRRFPPSVMLDCEHAPAFAMGMLVVMFVLDCLFNAMMNPIFVVAAGGLSGLSTLRVTPQRAVGGTARRVARAARRGRPREETEGRLQ
jgi:hypothetical protein